MRGPPRALPEATRSAASATDSMRHRGATFRGLATLGWWSVRLGAVAVIGATLATCTRDSTAPRAAARLVVIPQFRIGALVPGNGLFVDQVRVQLIRPPQLSVLDKTFSFSPSSSSLPISLTIPLQQSPDSFSLQLDYAHGSEVLYSGVQTVVLDAGASPQPVTVPVSYSGPGRSATSLTLAPRDTQLSSGDQVQFRVCVLTNTVPDSVYVGWRTGNAAQTIDATGHLT